MNIQPLTEGSYFHIYNRGVNHEDIFKEERNYHYFIQQYKTYCADVFETCGYALLRNHFHLLVYVKENVVVPKLKGECGIQLNASKQLGHFFNSYAQSINRSYKRTGPLFESPFERKKIDSDAYITSMIMYCHFNPQLHGFVNDFKEWEFTSYNAILRNDNSLLASDKVLEWFGSAEALEKTHRNKYNEIMFNETYDFNDNSSLQPLTGPGAAVRV